MNMQLPGANKFMDRLFRKADGVVWDLMTGKIGVQTEDGIATLEGEGDTAQININLLDDFSCPLPAFAQNTPVAGVVVGDIIYKGKSSIVWVIAKVDGGKFRVMNPGGTSSTWTPPKVSMLGVDGGVMVLRSLMTMLPGGTSGLQGMQSMMLPMMMMGGDGMDFEKIMPLMLMSQMGATAPDGKTAANPMGQMMPMLMMMNMMKGGGGPGGLLGGDDKKAGPSFRQ